ncbi:MAG: acyl-CoA synthetase [Gammaproteobacteria bacterium]|nr:acyl-CoA synthetase [Gammaproteobacteria bacterium]
MHLGVHRQSQPNKVAYRMVATGESVTYLQLDERSNQASHHFQHLGLEPRDGIAVLLDNHINYLQVCWAAQRSGLYYTPISTLFQQDEIEHILTNSDARVLVTSSTFLPKLNLKNFSQLKIFLVDEGDYPNWGEAISAFPTTPVANACEGAEMIYSSGTTGKPKGVRFQLDLSPPGTVSTLFQTRLKMHQVNESTRYLSTAPLYHSAPLRYNLMVTRMGGTSVIMDKFDAETALSLIEQFAITHSQWVPTMFVRLLKLPAPARKSFNLSSLRFAIHAAAPCPVEIKQAMIDWWGPILFEYYSGTEANGSTAITSQEWLTHKGSVGRAIHGEVRIVDEDDQELPANSIGTVYFANGSDFAYYKDPEQTAAARNERGWSTLGDVGYLDEDGFLYLRDRKSFMIISGGVNIYPQEIENTLINHEDVADVAVFGIPNDEFGEEVKAVVQLGDHSKASAQTADLLIDYCRSKISHAKCPRSIEFSEALPRHPTGKLYKRELREQYWKNHRSRII